MTLQAQKRLAQHVFRLLKVNEIVFPVGRTNKGNLGIKFSQNSEDFEIYLDAVPLTTKSIIEDDNNIELKKMLEKYLFTQPESFSRETAPAPIAPPKPRGRPKGSKNADTKAKKSSA